MTKVRIGAVNEGAPGEFHIQERPFRVIEVVDRWPGGDHAYFRVLDEKGVTYILRHDLASDEWEITLMDALEAGTRG